jgi:predicted metal-dependent HD superfamily phosphohydrolase
MDLNNDATPLFGFYNDLVRPYYMAAHRHYHDTRHIEDMFFSYVEFFGDEMTQAELLAIMYHDIVYLPWDSNNEFNSVKMLELHHKFYFPKVKQDLIDTASLIIMDTKHKGQINEFSKRVVDLDMMILGSEPLKYSEYGHNIRKEYFGFSDEVYRGGRKWFLETLLKQERIYETPKMYALFELKARKNIQIELGNINEK